ncbi:microtubule-associated protein 6 homolog [Hypomesus transpacificus]|uniref:microtubule-associated protein 6 homolog n=1 Tax=Hypomesus transpacificus TaxID=137520 RepID=UPI001F07DCA3|nr:microtubule-associated protein 6 homolog [Hypomesus transpacificus]
MAWPCISRVCCLARFWNQLDKSDLSVPLTIQNYSDISDQEVRSVTKQVPTDLVPRNNYSTPDHRGSPPAAGEATGNRRSLRGRKEPSFKPREDYQPSGVPFQSVTQYKQDFKPWPIPKKENFPWISNGGKSGDSISDSPINSHPNAHPHTKDERVERDERSRAPKWGEEHGTGIAKTSSYRQEYRAWTGAKPAKSTRKPPPALYASPGQGVTHPYSSPGAGAPHLPPETSYQAAFSGGEAHRHPELQHQGDHTTTNAATPTLQPISAPLQPSPVPCSLQQSSLSERPELSVSTRGEVQLVKTKLSPNPSAVFQSGPRIFNI